MPDKPRLISRRSLLRTAFGGGGALLAASLVGCDDGDATPTPTATRPAPATPPPRPSPTPKPLGWKLVTPLAGPLPPTRRDHSLVTDGATLYVFGGRNDSGDLADLWTFNSFNVEWTKVQASPGPSPRHGHNAIWDVFIQRLIVFGGQQGSTFLNDLWEFDPSSNQCVQLANNGSGPTPRYGAAAAQTFGPVNPPGRLLVTHGFTNAGRFDDTWGFNLLDHTWEDISPQGPRPVERCLMRGVWDFRSNFFMFGGQTTGTPFLGDLWALGPDGWRQIVTEPSPPPRTFYSFVSEIQAGRAILFGGNTQDGAANDLSYFDFATDTWERQTVGGGPSPRQGHDAVWLGDSRTMVVFGGNDGADDLNDLWQLSVPL